MRPFRSRPLHSTRVSQDGEVQAGHPQGHRDHRHDQCDGEEWRQTQHGINYPGAGGGSSQESLQETPRHHLFSNLQFLHPARSHIPGKTGPLHQNISLTSNNIDTVHSHLQLPHLLQQPRGGGDGGVQTWGQPGHQPLRPPLHSANHQPSHLPLLGVCLQIATKDQSGDPAHCHSGQVSVRQEFAAHKRQTEEEFAQPGSAARPCLCSTW